MLKCLSHGVIIIKWDNVCKTIAAKPSTYWYILSIISKVTFVGSEWFIENGRGISTTQ